MRSLSGWVLLLASCAGDATTTTPTDATLCEGAGEPALQLGDGGLSGFVAWVDDDAIAVEQDGAGTYGFYVDLLTDGIDTTTPVTTFVRYTIGADVTTEDVGATLSFQCPNEGPGWAGVFVPLDDTLQDATLVAGLDGELLALTGSVTDAGGDTVSVDVDLVVSAR